MTHRIKRLRFLLLSLVLLATSLLGISGIGTQKAQAAPAGSCRFTFTAQQLDTTSTDTKACTEYVAKFSQAARDAAVAGECYTYRNTLGRDNKTTITIESRSCGSDPVGTCTDQFVAQRFGDTTTNKVACNTITAKFEAAANSSADSRTCYLISEVLPRASTTNRVSLADTDCGNVDDASVGGEGFDGAPTGPGTITKETEKAFGTCAEDEENVSNACGLVEKYLNPLINVLAALVGLLAVIMIIVGGIQYASAGGDSKKVADAKARIFNAVLAVVVFIFLYAVLQWLVPGGLF